MKLIPITAVGALLGISRDKEFVREYALKNGYVVTTKRESPRVDNYYLSVKSVEEMARVRIESLKREIERLENDIDVIKHKVEEWKKDDN